MTNEKLNEMMERLVTSENLTHDEVYDLTSKACYEIMVDNKIGNFSDRIVNTIKEQVLLEANKRRFENGLCSINCRIE